MTLNFQLMQHHKYNLSDIENMMPWEREIYVLQLQKWIKEENERIEQKNLEMRSKSSRRR